MPQSTCHKANLTTFVALAAALALGAGGHAAELHVPGDYATIQAAIDAAVAGDEVILAPGTYNENISLLGKQITLRSTEPENPQVVHSTIIHGDGTVSTILCTSGETIDTVIDGLLIRNEPSSVQGGGMRISSSAVTVRNCVFFGIETSTAGGGLHASAGSFVSNCTFTSCRAQSGGGAFISTGPVPATFENCVFRNNVANNSGGAAFLLTAPTILNCTFEGNLALGAVNDGAAALHAPIAGTTLIGCSVKWNRSYANVGFAVGGPTGNPNMPVVSNSLFCENWPAHFATPGYIDSGGNSISEGACPPEVGACCLGGNCVIASGTDCIAGGGTYMGDGTICAAVACLAPECPSDIAPPGGDEAVNVNDLLKIINDWGACPNP